MDPKVPGTFNTCPVHDVCGPPPTPPPPDTPLAGLVLGLLAAVLAVAAAVWWRFYRHQRVPRIGRVVDESGAPVPGAAVWAISVGGKGDGGGDAGAGAGAPRRAVQSDADGRFVLMMPPGSSRVVRATKVGFEGPAAPVTAGAAPPATARATGFGRNAVAPTSMTPVVPQRAAAGGGQGEEGQGGEQEAVELMLLLRRCRFAVRGTVSGPVLTTSKTFVQGLSGAQVTFLANNGGNGGEDHDQDAAPTDAQGAYSLTLAFGSYIRRVTLGGYDSSFAEVVVRQQEDSLDAQLEITLFDVSGAVTEAPAAGVDGGGAEGGGAEGAALEGALVELLDPDSGAAVASCRAGPGGMYLLSAPPGRYLRRVSAPEHEPADELLELDDDVRVNAALAVTLYDVTGSVLDAEGGAPLQGARVRLGLPSAGGGGGPAASSAAAAAVSAASLCLSGAGGGYGWRLPAGTYTRRVSLEGYLGALEQAVVGRGGLAVEQSEVVGGAGGAKGAEGAPPAAGALCPGVTSLSKASSAVAGVVTSSASGGGPLEGAELTLTDTAGGGAVLVATAVSGEGGTYRMTAPLGTFEWRASAPGHDSAARTITTDSGEAGEGTDAALEVTAFTVRGRVGSEETGAPIAGATVRLVPAGAATEGGAGAAGAAGAVAGADSQRQVGLAEAESSSPAEQGGLPCLAVEVVSGADGAFTAAGLRPGRYTLTASAEEHLARSAPLAVEADVPAGSGAADLRLALRYFQAAGTVTDAESGEAVFDALVALQGPDADRNGAALRTDEGGAFALQRVLPGQHAVTVSAAGFQPRSVTFTSAQADLLTGQGLERGRGPADVQLSPLTYALAGRVCSGGGSGGGEGGAASVPLAGAVVWLKKNGKIKGRVVAGADGGYDLGTVTGGLYAVVAAAEEHMKMRTVVTLEADVGPGGAADLTLPKPLPAETDIGSQLVSRYGELKNVFQFYCSAAAVGENNPFILSLTQLNEYVGALKLPGGLSEPGDPVIDGMWAKCCAPTLCRFKLDGKGEVTGALRPDADKGARPAGGAMTFDEFLDFQVPGTVRGDAVRGASAMCCTHRHRHRAHRHPPPRVCCPDRPPPAPVSAFACLCIRLMHYALLSTRCFQLLPRCGWPGTSGGAGCSPCTPSPSPAAAWASPSRSSWRRWRCPAPSGWRQTQPSKRYSRATSSAVARARRW
jgi:hypothetical protein